jgi:glycosyltransferase involved in cell wall biosynthesis
MDLNNRNAFIDHAHVPTDLVATLGKEGPSPLVTIAIPTYRRANLLPAVVRSALAQKFDRPVEIVIVDNDNDEAARSAILASLPQDPRWPIRYHVNRENIGMFGNWNRCIELARGQWMTILNDDDLLRPDFLVRSFNAISRRPEIDGLVCKKLKYNWDTGRTVQPKWHQLAKAVAFRWRFDRYNLTRATTRKLFFGNELENGCGFLFKKDVLVAMGGYREEEFPASDFFLYIRFTISYNLFWLNEVLADIGIYNNESARKSTIFKSIGLANEYYKTMTENFVPRDWIRLRPLLVSNQVRAYQLGGVEFSPEELAAIEAEIGAPLPPPSYGAVRRFRLFHHGF